MKDKMMPERADGGDNARESGKVKKRERKELLQMQGTHKLTTASSHLICPSLKAFGLSKMSI